MTDSQWRETVLADIKRHEGLRLKPYKDTVGKLTIGYGRNLEDVGIDEPEAGMLLAADIRRTLEQLDAIRPSWREHPATVTRALADMAFNLGAAGLDGFTRMWAALDARDYTTAAREALDSKWATQVGLRAQEDADLIEAGGMVA